MDKYEKNMHSERSFVDQLTGNAQISQLEALEDISLELADPFSTLWSPQTEHSMPSLPHDLVRSDIEKTTSQTSACFDKHPKLTFLNEIQNQYRGVVGAANQTDYLVKKVFRSRAPRVNVPHTMGKPGSNLCGLAPKVF